MESSVTLYAERKKKKRNISRISGKIFYIDVSLTRAFELGTSETEDLSKISTDDLQSIIIEQERRIALLENTVQEKCEGAASSYKYSDEQFRKLETRILNLEFLLEETADSKSILNKRKPRNFIGSYSNRVLSGDRDQYMNVAFDAYRNEPFYRPQSYINYDAPLPGIYLFSFHALTKDGQPSYVKLNHNGRNVAGSYRRHEVEMPEGMPDYKDRLENSKAEGMLSQTVLLNLEKGDEVGVFAYHGNIRDGGWHYTHFVGVRIH
ncbi:C1QL [Lepeophtheirus salmonis]|uniref:C1QL n=1 Tax=Lepeophtheirus salmonis TaxID=72036 RepID=A0A817FAH8_LEPSM|nr:C1QL [Lepeophtheirus salmonis]CAG9475235.1 C1QL [Lepeophtheirus salmonis]